MERHSTTVHLAYYFHIETGTVNSVELGVYKPMCIKLALAWGLDSLPQSAQRYIQQSGYSYVTTFRLDNKEIWNLVAVGGNNGTILFSSSDETIIERG